MTEANALFLISATLFTVLAILGPVTGSVFLLAFGKIDRDERPTAFWITVGLNSFVALFCWHGAVWGVT